ncbi:MAG: hypothetical protein GY796_34525 [Chloroflexi bacterium]|nr:hypothetical protein [Chloroflexota bacterium]
MKRYNIVEVKLLGVILLVLAVALLAGCQNESAVIEETAVPEAAAAPTAVPTTPPEPTPIPEPTSTPEPAMITSADEMVGIWLGTIAGEKGYVMYTDDGRYTVALVQENLGTAPRVSGEYWFEAGKIHLRDLENVGHWVACDAEMVGVYEVAVLEDDSLQFQTVEDNCNEGGFTRNYLFANMTQEWIAEPVALAE